MDISGLRTTGSIKAWLPVTDEVKILCSHITQDVWEALRTEATDTTYDTSKGKTTDDFDSVKFRLLVARHVVLDISGVTDGEDAEGNPLPLTVTPENIDLLMTKWAAFRATVLTAPLNLSAMLTAQRDEQKKNSERTSSDDSISPESPARRAPKIRK